MFALNGYLWGKAPPHIDRLMKEVLRLSSYGCSTRAHNGTCWVVAYAITTAVGNLEAGADEEVLSRRGEELYQ